jgi:hypothetical protein
MASTARPRLQQAKLRVKIAKQESIVLQMGPQATLRVKIAGLASTLDQLLRPASHVQLEST